MSHVPSNASPASPLHAIRSSSAQGRHIAALAVGALFPMLCVSSVFWMHVDVVALLREWDRTGAGMALIAIATLAAGAVLASCVGESRQSCRRCVDPSLQWLRTSDSSASSASPDRESGGRIALSRVR